MWLFQYIAGSPGHTIAHMHIHGRISVCLHVYTYAHMIYVLCYLQEPCKVFQVQPSRTMISCCSAERAALPHNISSSCAHTQKGIYWSHIPNIGFLDPVPQPLALWALGVWGSFVKAELWDFEVPKAAPSTHSGRGSGLHSRTSKRTELIPKTIRQSTFFCRFR